jgi:hypothetical protein
MIPRETKAAAAVVRAQRTRRTNTGYRTCEKCDRTRSLGYFRSTAPRCVDCPRRHRAPNVAAETATLLEARRIELRLTLARLAPSQEDREALERAASRWGCSAPAPYDVLEEHFGDPLPPLASSVVSLLAQVGA